MRTEITSGPTAAHVFQPPPSGPETTESRACGCRLPARSSDPQAGHDATLIVAALEDLEAQRAAMEWLLDANLLHLCLI